MEFAIILDDEQNNTINISESIEFEDIEIISFNDPLEFIKFIDTDPKFKYCRLLIVDFSMPKMTGYEVFEKVFKGDFKYKRHDVLYSGNLNQIRNDEIEYLLENKVQLIEKPNIEQIIELAITNVTTI